MIFEAAASSRKYSIGFGTGHIKERMLMITKRKNIFISILAFSLSVISIIASFTVPVEAKNVPLPDGIDADLPHGELLDGPNGQKIEFFLNLMILSFPKTLSLQKNIGTLLTTELLRNLK